MGVAGEISSSAAMDKIKQSLQYYIYKSTTPELKSFNVRRKIIILIIVVIKTRILVGFACS